MPLYESQRCNSGLNPKPSSLVLQHGPSCLIVMYFRSSLLPELMIVCKMSFFLTYEHCHEKIPCFFHCDFSLLNWCVVCLLCGLYWLFCKLIHTSC